MADEAEIAELIRMLPVLRRLVLNDTSFAEAAGISTKVTTTDDQTITGEKSLKDAPLRMQDEDGKLVHAFGTKS